MTSFNNESTVGSGRFGCDHEFISIKDIKAVEDAKIKGKLIVCHHCGIRKEVYESGQIKVIKNNK